MATSYTKKQLEDIIAGLNTKMEGMEKSLDSLKDVSTKVDNLETLLKQANEKNASLITALEDKEKKLNALSLKLNALEQHHRSWSVRVNGVQLSSAEEVSIRAVKNRVFNEVLKPILAGAVECGDLHEVPCMDNVIEHAHVLPAREGQVKPIICRFTIREYRSLVFKHKKTYAPREAADPPNRARPGRYRFPFFEDLTKMTFTKMRAIATHPRVEACWSSGGQLRFKLKEGGVVHRVHNVLDTADDIVSSV